MQPKERRSNLKDSLYSTKLYTVGFTFILSVKSVEVPVTSSIQEDGAFA